MYLSKQRSDRAHQPSCSLEETCTEKGGRLKTLWFLNLFFFKSHFYILWQHSCYSPNAFFTPFFLLFQKGDKISILIIDQVLAGSTSCYTAHKHQHIHRLTPPQSLLLPVPLTGCHPHKFWCRERRWHGQANTHTHNSFLTTLLQLSHTTTSSSSLLSVSRPLCYTQGSVVGYLPLALLIKFHGEYPTYIHFCLHHFFRVLHHVKNIMCK